MTEQIGQKLVTTIGSIIPTFYSEAETETYPYCKYKQTLTMGVTKDEVYKIESACEVSIVSDSFDEADQKSSQVQTAIANGMTSGQFWSRLLTMAKECVDGIWTITLSYNIKQLF